MGAGYGKTVLKGGVARRWFRAIHIVFWGMVAIGTFLLVDHLRETHVPSVRRGGAAAKHPSSRPAGKVIATIPMPNGAFDIASGAGSIWVATNSSSNPGAPGSETDVARIDAATNRVVAPLITTSDWAIDGLGASSGGAVIDEQLQWLSAKTNAVTTPALAQDCGQPSFAGDTVGDVWFVISDHCGLLGKFDTLTGRVTRIEPFSTGGQAQIATGDGQVWVANSNSTPAMLERLNLSTGRLERIRQIVSGALIAVGDGVVGILNYYSTPPTLIRISDRDLAMLGRTALIYEHAPNAALVEGGSRFWLSVTLTQANNIVAYSAQSGQPVGAPIPLGAEEFGTPGSMTFAFGSLWTSGKNRVLRIKPNP
jgi:hypothetical protein